MTALDWIQLCSHITGSVMLQPVPASVANKAFCMCCQLRFWSLSICNLSLDSAQATANANNTMSLAG